LPPGLLPPHLEEKTENPIFQEEPESIFQNGSPPVDNVPPPIIEGARAEEDEEPSEIEEAPTGYSFENFPAPPAAPFENFDFLKDEPAKPAAGAKQPPSDDEIFGGRDADALASLSMSAPGTLREKARETKAEKLKVPEPPRAATGSISIACIFPNGHEREGQDFVRQLRGAGGKGAKPVSIDAVYVHAWSPGQIDVAGWKKAAALSGATLMYVLTSKKERELFGALGEAGTIRTRLVLLEHVSLRTLYADLMADLVRSSNGKT